MKMNLSVNHSFPRAVLDCHTHRSALQSISTIYNAPEKDIDAVLKGMDLDAYYRSQDPDTPPGDVVAKLLEREIEHCPRELDYVHWFHLTRVPRSQTFDRGILPLTRALDDVWDMLIAAVQQPAHAGNLRSLRQNGLHDSLYCTKAQNALHGGPYAMLVREVAFCAEEIGNHDYLALPEIVEDICRNYERRFEVSIVDEVIASLVPCIVKFRSNQRLGRDCIHAALYYLYLIGHEEPLNLQANTCFDGQDNAVPPEDIVKVEFLPPET